MLMHGKSLEIGKSEMFVKTKKASLQLHKRKRERKHAFKIKI